MNFNDGLPNDPRYVLGIDDPSNDNTPSSDPFEPIRVPFIRPLKSSFIKRVKRMPEPSCDIMLTEEEEAFCEAHKHEDYIYIDLDTISKKNEAKRNKPSLKIHGKKLDIPKDIVPENLVDIPRQLLEDISEVNEKLADEISDIILKKGATAIIAFDTALNYSSAVLKDGFGLNSEVEDDLKYAINGILKLSLLLKYIDFFDLPEDAKKEYTSKMIELMVISDHDNMRKHVNTSKHRKIMQSFVGQVTDKAATMVGRGNSGGKFFDVDDEREQSKSL